MTQNERKVTGNMMSNAKLKEQIEAAKIALVHSAEVDTFTDKPTASSNFTSSPKIDTDHAQPHGDSVTNTDKTADIDTLGHTDSIVDRLHSPVSAETQIVGRETITQSDFEKLEIRLQTLEDQIKNQQRDLHTLLQKLRDITAKSQAVAKPKKSKGTKKWLVGAALWMIGFGAIYYWLGAEVIIATIYQATGLIVALIDTLAGKI